MKFIPKQHQIRAMNFLLSHPKAALILDLGLGKTVVTLSYLQYLIHRKLVNKILVVAPLRPVYNVWPDEISKWNHLNLTYNILHGPNRDIYLIQSKNIYFINFEGLRWLYDSYQGLKFPFDCLIIDESTFIKNPRSKRFAYLRLFSLSIKYCILLTGAIAPNSILDIWSQYYILDNGQRLGGSFETFKKTYFTAIDYNQYKWEPNPGTIHYLSNKVSDISLRMRTEDYISLPDKYVNDITCTLSKSLMKKYKKFEREFILELENNTIEAFSVTSLSIKLRQFLAGAIYTENTYTTIHTEKINALKEILEIYENPVLIAIQFRFEYEMLKKEFPEIPIIYGGVSAKQGSDLLEKWNKQKLSRLVVHPQSVAHGLNLQAGGCCLLWMNLPWSADQYQQLNGRLHRTGQIKPVFINRIIIKNTLDQVISRTLNHKMTEEQNFLNELIINIKSNVHKNDLQK